MEYLSRILKSMSDLSDFNFHHVCKALRLTHLLIVDNFMIFYKGDLKSISRVIETFTHFSSTLRLVVNLEKSSSFIAGMEANVKVAILEKTCSTQSFFFQLGI